MTDVVVGEPPAVCEITLPEVLASAPQPKNTCHQLDSGTIRLGDGTACSEGRLNINKILPRLPFVKMKKTKQRGVERKQLHRLRFVDPVPV